MSVRMSGGLRFSPVWAAAVCAVLAGAASVLAAALMWERPVLNPRPVAQFPPSVSTLSPEYDGTYGPGSRKEAHFLELVRLAGMPFSSDRQIVDAAHTVCTDLGNGLSFMETAVSMGYRIPWMMGFAGGLFVMQSTSTYCPELGV